MKPLRLFFSITLFLVLALFAFATPFVASAVSRTPIGGRCVKSHECGRNLGCRESVLGVFGICKITVPGTDGCAGEFPENMCADGMTCRDDRCIPTYGVEDIAPGNLSISVDPPQNPAIALPSLAPLKDHLNLSTARKVLNVILAIALLIGITLVIHGVFLYEAAIGHVPIERTGLRDMGIGSAIIVGSVLLWILTQ